MVTDKNGVAFKEGDEVVWDEEFIDPFRGVVVLHNGALAVHWHETTRPALINETLYKKHVRIILPEPPANYSDISW